METTSCPICKRIKFYNPRYPNEICKQCVGRVTDGHGRFLKFYNRTISDGYIGFYADTDGKEEYPSSICYVSKQKCEVKEDKFGGIVVELIQLETKKEDISTHSEENE